MQIITLLSLISLVGAALAEATFTKAPTATPTPDGVRIEFAASVPTDAIVEVRDAQGQVVRHLAAARLGAAPFSCLWDRRDDAGTPVPPGRYTVHVRLGLAPVFDRTLGWAPNALGAIQSLAVGPGGELFVLNTASRYHAADSTPVCQVFDREGRYLRTIMPYSANLPAVRVEAFGRLHLEGRTVPFVHHGENYSIYPGLKEPWRQGMAVTPYGRLVFLSAPGRGGYHVPTANRFFAIATDGGARGAVFGPLLARDGYGPVCLATASASRTPLATMPAGDVPHTAVFYAAGVRSGFMNNPRVHHCVYRFRWPDAQAEPYIGRPFEPGHDEAHLNDPRGVATDGEGNIYVSDRGNDRIAVFRADGSFLGQVPVEAPDFLAVHRRTGTVYVLGGRPAGALIKLSGYRGARELARFELRGLFRDDRWTHGLVMALDDRNSDAPAAEGARAEAGLPVIWLGSPISQHGFGLLRLEDRGTAFGEPQKMGSDPIFLHGSPGHLSVDRTREELYASTAGRTYRFDGRTGEGTIARTYGEGDLWVVGADGLVYAHHTVAGKQVVSRWTRDFQPVPFASKLAPSRGEGAPLTPILSPAGRGGTAALPANAVAVPGSIHLKARGLTAARDGTIYVIREVRNHRVNEVRVIAPDGTVKHESLIAALTGGASSVRVDNAGNVYVADCAKPKGEVVPAELRGKVPETPLLESGAVNWYPVIYGSVVKFAPTGGGIFTEPKPGATEVVVGYQAPRWMTGARWQWAGMSPVPTFAGDGGQDHAVYCGCERGSFDVDDFGRSFVPDAARFCVHVLDPAGQEILRFGEYGNQDTYLAAGLARSESSPSGTVPFSEKSVGKGDSPSADRISFGWPISVAVSDEAAYVGDVVNRRIVRVKLTYRAAQTCSVEVK
jgi:hypothetical protein